MRRCAVAVVACLALLTACGGDDDPTVSPAATGTTMAPDGMPSPADPDDGSDDGSDVDPGTDGTDVDPDPTDGSDDGGPVSAEAARFCQLLDEFDDAGDRIFDELDFETMDEAELEAALRDGLRQLQPEMDALRDEAPAEVRDDVATVLDAIQEVIDGDMSFEEAEQNEVANAAGDAMDSWEEQNC